MKPRPPWLRAYALALAACAPVGILCLRRILARAAEPALPLDDSFIHLQFAAELARGHWFRYSPGGGYSSGATSFLWPAAFVPFFWLGLTDLQLVWVAWAFGLLLHAAIAYETWRLGRDLCGGAAALGAGAMCATFGAFAWFAYSGMETLALGWVLVRGARVAAETREGQRGPAQLALFGLLAPLVRPEGALVSLMAVLTASALFGRSRAPLGRRLALALASSAGPLFIPLSHLVFAGHAAAATAVVKHLAFDPYLSARQVAAETLANAKLLCTDLLDGGAFTAVFVPRGFAFALAAGLGALPFAARRSGRSWRALMIALLVLGTLGPTTYATMLWNRVRYIWPFAPGWFLAVAALCGEIGARLRRSHRFFGIAAPALSFGAAALLSGKLDWATADLATSARAISRQQVRLGKWARENLPGDALIAVNDTGAIAYLSKRPIFDVVGLTTEGEARYWAAGAGARFEHYERMRRAGARLPTDLFVYRQWMAMTPIYGEELTSATVNDQSILGGRTMDAMLADYSLLGSGELPFSPGLGQPDGSLDVADLESEAEHGYQLGDARSHWCLAERGLAPNGRWLADGGRIERGYDQFFLGERGAVTLVMRVRSPAPLEVWADAERVGLAKPLSASADWQELAIELPRGAKWVTARPAEPKRFASFHYWWWRR